MVFCIRKDFEVHQADPEEGDLPHNSQLSDLQKCKGRLRVGKEVLSAHQDLHLLTAQETRSVKSESKDRNLQQARPPELDTAVLQTSGCFT